MQYTMDYRTKKCKECGLIIENRAAAQPLAQRVRASAKAQDS